ncbi:MAG: hypothetical protein V2I65_02205 [Paracoccaceae bacterium]|jgi:hypothetical protein|nr:hypothetical protein [Paracoccaceae bacterium]
MMGLRSCLVVATAVGIGTPAMAAPTQSSAFIGFFGGESLFGPARGIQDFEESVTFGPSFAEVTASTEADFGTVVSFVTSSLRGTFEETVSAADAPNWDVLIERLGGGGTYDVNFNARAGIEVDFFDLPGAFDPPPFDLLSAGYNFQSQRDVDLDFGPTFGVESREDLFERTIRTPFPFVNVAVGAEFDIIHNGELTFTSLTGELLATHESGATRRSAFDLTSGAVLTQLDLSLPGEWDISLEDVRLLAEFRSRLRLEPGANIGYGISIPPFSNGCGDFGKNSDNTVSIFGVRTPSCTADSEDDVSVSRTVVDQTFDLLYDPRRASLGTVSVAAPPPPPPPAPAPVPGPAALPLLGSALLLAGLLARRRP